jgi:hypothetical protein
MVENVNQNYLIDPRSIFEQPLRSQKPSRRDFAIIVRCIELIDRQKLAAPSVMGP